MEYIKIRKVMPTFMLSGDGVSPMQAPKGLISEMRQKYKELIDVLKCPECGYSKEK